MIIDNDITEEAKQHFDYCNSLPSYLSHDFTLYRPTQDIKTQGIIASNALFCKHCKLIVSPGIFGENTIVKWYINIGKPHLHLCDAARGDMPKCPTRPGVMDSSNIDPSRFVELYPEARLVGSSASDSYKAIRLSKIVMQKSATFSDDKQHRYDLRRVWDKSKGLVMFIGLNPSTATATKDDPTIRRCIRYAEDWGYGGLVMANLFGFRATKPADMKAASDPIGPENDAWLLNLASESALVVLAWGNHGAFKGRDKDVIDFVPNDKTHYLKLNKSGSPTHPLYLPADLIPIKYN